MRVLIIGAGASGMTAALTAARAGHGVTLFERQARVGRKLSATGNGRCNLTNTGADASHYHGEDPDFVRPALEMFTVEDALAMFRGIGLITREEYGGRVYPLSNSAASVTDTLRFALEAEGVRLVAGDRVRSLERRGGVFAVTTESGARHEGEAAIVACGGLAGEKLGGGKDGYELLKSLGHTRTSLYPALAPICTAPEFPRALKGVKADCAMRLLRGRETLAESAGEALFAETGVSGPAAFDLARTVSTAGDGLTLSLDLLRGLSFGEALAHLRARAENAPQLTAGELFIGAVPNRLARMLAKYAGLRQDATAASLDAKALKALAGAAKNFALPVRGTEGFANAQVTAGGIKTSEFDPAILRSRIVPGLYACGEVLDIDGDCGGYNLQWAWSSGHLAGRLL